MEQRLGGCIWALGLYELIVWDNKKKKFLIIDVPNKAVTGPK
jgi:hypothetical protein